MLNLEIRLPEIVTNPTSQRVSNNFKWNVPSFLNKLLFTLEDVVSIIQLVDYALLY